MTNKDKIILYLDGQMDEADRSFFEKELASDPELKSELLKYKEFINDIISLKNINTDPDYFINIIPEFRKKLDKRKKIKLIPKLVVGLTTITAVIMLLVLTMKRPDNGTVNFTSTENVDSLIDNYTFSYSPLQDEFDMNALNSKDYSNIDSTVTVMLSNELNLSSQSLSDLTVSNGTTDLQSILQGVNNQEAEQIYKELLHKRIY